MNYQKIKTLVEITSGLILFIAYCLLVLPRISSAETSGDLHYWAIIILSFIGISILVTIVIQIVFHVLFSVSIAINEKVKDITLEDNKIGKLVDKKIKLEMIEDERDNLIKLKALRVGYYFSGFGLFVSILALAFGYTAAVMLNILLVSFMLGSILEGTVRYYFYSRD